MIKRLIITLISTAFIACSPTTKEVANQEEEEWISLFNGSDLSGWDIKIAGRPINDNFKRTFVVEDSMLRVKYDQYEEFDDLFGHIYYKEPFSYYKLKLNYRFLGEQLKGGATWNVRNSGVMLHSQSAASNELSQHFPISVELQLLGGLNDGQKRTTGNVCTPGVIVQMADTLNYDHCINSSSKTYDGDQWIHAEAIVMGGEEMTFIIEGDTVLNFQKPQIGDGNYMKWGSPFDWAKFGIKRDAELWKSKAGQILESGYIALQAESHAIDFKNIELLNLCGCTDSKAKNYKTYYVKSDPKQCIY